MRNLISRLVLITLVSVVGMHSAMAGSPYLIVEDPVKNAQTVAIRKACGNLSHVIDLLRERIGDDVDDGEVRATSYADHIAEIVDWIVGEEMVPPDCIIPLGEKYGAFILSTSGDAFIGLNKKAITLFADR